MRRLWREYQRALLLTAVIALLPAVVAVTAARLVWQLSSDMLGDIRALGDKREAA